MTKKLRSFELLSEEGVAASSGNGNNGDLCSPDQAKTFSEDINLTEAQSSDLSMTVDQDATYTTVEEKTCVTVNGGGILHEEHCDDMMADDNVFTDNTFLKENERISEISEPEWEVTYSEKEKNPDEHSLLGLDSLDLLLDGDTEECREKNDNDNTAKNLNTIESDDKLSELSFNSQRDKDEGISSSKDESENNDDETSDDDGNNSTKKFCNTTSTTSSENGDDNNGSINQQTTAYPANEDGASEFSQLNKNLVDFINKEVEYNSSQYYYSYSKNHSNSCVNDSNDNSNANIPNDSKVVALKTQPATIRATGYNKISVMGNNNYSGKVLIPNSEGYLIEYNETNGNEKYHNQIDLIRPNKYQPLFVNNGGIYDLDLENYDNGMIVNHHHHHHHHHHHQHQHHAYLSGEDDPWSGYQINNGGGGGGDMYSGDTQLDNQNVTTTTFNLNEWESDEEDDSNSSEEFMYVKGNTNINSSPLTKKSQELKNKYNNYQNLSNNSSSNNDRDNEDKDMDDDDDDVWATHQDQIPVAGDKGPIRESEDESCDDSSSDVEGEFIPSSWDAEAQPARSALKSPDKSSSEEEYRGTKKQQRSVAFKKQRYHSVYEYPREVIPLSPAYSEPQMWDRNSSMNRFDNTSDYNLDDDDVLDGWKVSSSTRPFHGSQFSPQCNTWPTDSDFSWSQLLTCNDDQNIKYQDYSDLQIEWPTDFNDFFEKADSKDNNSDDDVQRPDSGVGESAELLSESVSLGDLKHTKSLLRLPLNVTSVVSSDNVDNTNTIKLDDETNTSDNFIVPTPSFTGSMDSLSTSSNGSDRPITFTTFGKPPLVPPTSIEQFENTKNTTHLVEMQQPQVVQQTCTPATLLLIDAIRNELKDVLEIKENTTNHDRTKRQSDSTDEASSSIAATSTVQVAV